MGSQQKGTLVYKAISVGGYLSDVWIAVMGALVICIKSW